LGEISYIEVPKKYDVLQRMAREQGLKDGDEIGSQLEREIEYNIQSWEEK